MKKALLEVFLMIAFAVVVGLSWGYLNDHDDKQIIEKFKANSDAQYRLDSNIVARVQELQVEVLQMQQVMKAQAHEAELNARNDDAMINLVGKVIDRVKALEDAKLETIPDWSNMPLDGTNWPVIVPGEGVSITTNSNGSITIWSRSE